MAKELPFYLEKHTKIFPLVLRTFIVVIVFSFKFHFVPKGFFLKYITFHRTSGNDFYIFLLIFFFLF